MVGIWWYLKKNLVTGPVISIGLCTSKVGRPWLFTCENVKRRKPGAVLEKSMMIYRRWNNGIFADFEACDEFIFKNNLYFVQIIVNWFAKCSVIVSRVNWTTIKLEIKKRQTQSAFLWRKLICSINVLKQHFNRHIQCIIWSCFRLLFVLKISSAGIWKYLLLITENRNWISCTYISANQTILSYVD